MEGLFEARYNTYWYLSFFLPLVIMIGGAFFQKRGIFVFSIITSLLVTFWICELSIFEKWKIGEAMAIANDEWGEYNKVDDTERKIRAFYIASIESILYTSIWAVVGWQLWPLLKRRQVGGRVPPPKQGHVRPTR